MVSLITCFNCGADAASLSSAEVADRILWVFTATRLGILGNFAKAHLHLGHHLKRWRGARIVVLQKSGKPEYSIPGAYRPISLLNTLGKLLEAVVARRLSYLTEKHGLLPDT